MSFADAAWITASIAPYLALIFLAASLIALASVISTVFLSSTNTTKSRSFSRWVMKLPRYPDPPEITTTFFDNLVFILILSHEQNLMQVFPFLCLSLLIAQ